MKTRILLLFLALAFMLSATTRAQDTRKPAMQTHAKPRTAAALVSADAKSFMDQKHGQWAVVNPEALSGYQNQRVKVKYLLSTERNQAQILSVKPIPAVTQTTAQKTDSAFRR